MAPTPEQRQSHAHTLPRGLDRVIRNTPRFRDTITTPPVALSSLEILPHLWQRVAPHPVVMT
ncbi:MAG: hypothetical protein VYE67_00145 [Planctomycetota bacterium]|nr:hypothetical protein [Planctomycetota bacterium]